MRLSATINNIYVDIQPYPVTFIRPVYLPNGMVQLMFPYWSDQSIMPPTSITSIINGDTGVAFVNQAEFQSFVASHF